MRGCREHPRPKQAKAEQWAATVVVWGSGSDGALAEAEEATATTVAVLAACARPTGSNRNAVVLLSNSMHYWCLVTGPRVPIARHGRCAIVRRYWRRRDARRHNQTDGRPNDGSDSGSTHHSIATTTHASAPRRHFQHSHTQITTTPLYCPISHCSFKTIKKLHQYTDNQCRSYPFFPKSLHFFRYLNIFV